MIRGAPETFRFQLVTIVSEAVPINIQSTYTAAHKTRSINEKQDPKITVRRSEYQRSKKSRTAQYQCTNTNHLRSCARKTNKAGQTSTRSHIKTLIRTNPSAGEGDLSVYIKNKTLLYMASVHKHHKPVRLAPIASVFRQKQRRIIIPRNFLQHFGTASIFHPERIPGVIGIRECCNVQLLG
jgi:hypothetical protein